MTERLRLLLFGGDPEPRLHAVKRGFAQAVIRAREFPGVGTKPAVLVKKDLVAGKVMRLRRVAKGG